MRHLFLILALGCGSATKPAPVAVKPQPAKRLDVAEIVRVANTLEPSAMKLEFGDATAWNGADPILRLRPDGTIEQRTGESWAPTFLLASDGTVHRNGKPFERLTPARLADIGIQIDGREVRGKTPHGELALTLLDDGRISATLGMAGNGLLRIEGSDPAVRRTLFLWLAVVAIVNYRNENPAGEKPVQQALL